MAHSALHIFVSVKVKLSNLNILPTVKVLYSVTLIFFLLKANFRDISRILELFLGFSSGILILFSVTISHHTPWSVSLRFCLLIISGKDRKDLCQQGNIVGELMVF